MCEHGYIYDQFVYVNLIGVSVPLPTSECLAAPLHSGLDCRLDSQLAFRGTFSWLANVYKWIHDFAGLPI